jgi:flagellar protein FlaG
MKMAAAVDRVGAFGGASAAFPSPTSARPTGEASDSIRQAQRPIALPGIRDQAQGVDGKRQAPPEQLPTPTQQSPSRYAAVVEKLGYKNKNVRLDFSKDEETGEIVVKVVDRDSGEVVRELPPEELRHVAKILNDLQKRAETSRGQLVEVVT